MEKTKKTATANQNQSGGNFLSPVPLDEFKQDIADVFLFYVRTIVWMVDADAAWSLTKLPAADQPRFSLMDPQYRAGDLGIGFDCVAHIPLARVLISLYDYAYLGRQNMTMGHMEDETEYTWITAMLVDASAGDVSNEWDAIGSPCRKSAAKCLQIAQLANARAILEGDEGFYVFRDGRGVVDGGWAELSIKQLALLAGMEEMSVRAAANPKRPAPLETTHERGTTSISPEVAKKWLRSKGRYIPVTRHWGNTAINLSERGFGNVVELLDLLGDMYRNLQGSAEFATATAQLSAIGLKPCGTPLAPSIEISVEQLRRPEVQQGLSAIFSLDCELFALRVQEVLATEELKRIGRAIRDQKTSKSDATAIN